MKNSTLKYFIIAGTLTFFIACSVKKDKFINRNYHALTSEFNVLYHGDLALQEGVQGLVNNYNDNFWEILPIERLPKTVDQLTPNETKNPSFERAEDKAVKAIQKHSMNIAGSEKNSQMDEAYLLLGKSRYYENRFLPALEAFNYVLYKYPQSNNIYQAKVWREKVNIRLENEEGAIKNLKKLIANKQISGQDLADANAILTQAYVNLGSNDSAVATIKVAKEKTKLNEEKARYLFILGQLYESLNYQDSARMAFDEVIQMNRRSPRRYVINAHVKKAKQYSSGEDTLTFTKKFNELIEDRENRPFLDILYHEYGNFYSKNKLTDKAKNLYNLSLKTKSRDSYLVASNYRNIADIHFEDAQYKKASFYYDSTLTVLDNRSREYRSIKKKRENLNDVIRYEDIAKTNDSILAIVKMNTNERENYFTEYIAKLKVEDEKKAKLAIQQAEKEKNIEQNTGASLGKGALTPMSDVAATKSQMMPPGMGAPDGGSSNFYFYNPMTVSFGISEFQSKWGKIKLQENWKLNAITKPDFSSEDPNETSEDSKEELQKANPLYELAYYLEAIPTDSKTIDSLATERNTAYYQLGLIYKEKFKEYELAADRFEQLLKNNPEEKLILPSKYNLFRIYEQLKSEKALTYKNQIITEYPNSRYVQIIQNPASSSLDNASPVQVYNRLYKEWNANQIKNVYEELNFRIEQFYGDEMIPKFEMLKAKAIGRLKGLTDYKNALNWVAVNYPNQQEGKEAAEMLKTELPKLEALQLPSKEVSSWKIIFPETKDAKQVVVEKIQKYITDSKRTDLSLSTDLYSENENFIVLHGFVDADTAFATLSLLKEQKDYKLKHESYIISTEDYKIVQIKKQFEDWKKLKKN